MEMNVQEKLADLLLKIEGLEQRLQSPAQSEWTKKRHVLFTETEIMQMPKAFRKSFRLNGRGAHFRKRIDRSCACPYELSYAKKPYNKTPIVVTGETLHDVKIKFIEKLNSMNLMG